MSDSLLLAPGANKVAGKGYWKRRDVLDAHAKNRRERYATDAEYREAERQRQRALYAERTGKAHRNRAREALEKLLDSSEEAYTCGILSAMMDRSKTYLTRLVAKGLWPDPRRSGRRDFTRAQAIRLLTVLADHEDKVSTYRVEHKDTKRRLFAAYDEEE